MSAVAGFRAAETPECVDFGALKIAFDSQVLAPRPWTAAQAEWAAEAAEGAPVGPILELCSGAGHIGLLAAVLSGRRLVQVDSEALACQFARVNAQQAGVSEAVEIRCGDIVSALHPDELFPLIIADPPYIPSAEIGRFPDDPRAAIVGGRDGLHMIGVCLDVVARHLSQDGVCVLQARGPSQLEAVAPLVENRSLVVRAVRVVDDERALALLSRAGDGR